MKTADGYSPRRPGPRDRQPGGRGFTLIELLAVVAIIGLLVAILLPVLIQARAMARRTACQGSLSAIGKAVAFYQTTFGDYVPICWANIAPQFAHPWKSWRASLLPYAPGPAAFNCPAARAAGEIFHTPDDITGQDFDSTKNAGSYGVMYQYALPGYIVPDYSDVMKKGHTAWSAAFSTQPHVSWRDPANSVYVADCYLAKGPIAYPTPDSFKDYGTSAIVPPSDPGYFDVAITRRFADRHLGTNCLFVGGHVLSYATKDLDGMVAGQPGCVWSTE